MSDLQTAIAIAVAAHSGQVDKAGEPYILHPLRIMFNVSGELERTVAVLHDVVEDSEWTLEGLREEGFSDAVVAGVEALTRREGESYMEFVRRAAGHPVGRVVKRADLVDNMDLSRIPEPTEKDRERLRRYERALELLGDRSRGS